MREPSVLCQFKEVSIGVGDSKAPLLSDVNLTITTGDTLVFHGPSGGGKSTLLKALLGGCYISGGEYFFQGQLVDSHVLNEIRQTMAYIPQQPEIAKVTVLDYLQHPFSWKAFAGKAFNQHDACDWLDRFGLDKSLLFSFCDRLSGGQRQRLAIVRALITGRKIMVADEPTSALDDEACQKVVAALLTGGFTIISASHDVRWMSHCHRKILVANATICEEQNRSHQHKSDGIDNKVVSM